MPMLAMRVLAMQMLVISSFYVVRKHDTMPVYMLTTLRAMRWSVCRGRLLGHLDMGLRDGVVAQGRPVWLGAVKWCL